MSSTVTPNFGLFLPTPGTDEPFRISDINTNWTLVDTLARAVSCTSVTQPSSPFAGQMIFETNTLLLRRRNDANSAWVTVAGLAITATSGGPPSSPTAGQSYFESDTGTLVVRNNGGTWQHTGIPAVSSTTLIVAPRTGQVVFLTTGNTLMRYTGGAWAVYSMFTHAVEASVLTAETTSSTSYTDLATVGPSTGSITSVGTKALVMISAGAFTNSAVNIGHAMSFVVSGATTLAASDVYARIDTCDNAGFGMNVTSYAYITITPGVNNYTAKYKLSGATTSTFNNRRIWVYAP